MVQIPLTAAQIAAYDSRRRRAQGLYRENDLYARGKNPHIQEMTKKRDPDNRLALPFAKMAVADMCGYAGRAGDRTIEIDNITTNASAKEDAAQDDFINHVKVVYDYNETDTETAELYHEALVQGRAYEIVWATDDLPGAGLMAEYAMVPGDEVVMVYDDSIKRNVIGAVWYHEATAQDGRAILVADAYYPGESHRWIQNGGGWQRDPEGDTFYPFEDVPVIEYTINRQKESFFEAEKGILFGLDKLLSSSVNEVDRFNAVLALFPFKVSQEFVENLKQMNVIDDLDQFERWPEYLEKNLGAVDSFYNALADRLERLFHKSIKVPDFSDENFAGNSSGIALSYKLLAMEFLAAQIDAYFDRGIETRYNLIAQAINAGGRQFPIDDYELIIDNKRNLPVDEATKVQIAQQLLGIVSEETILKMLPNTIVPDVERELERLGSGANMDLDGDDIMPMATNEEKVQDTALNGAQIQGIQSIVQAVADGTLPADSAVQLIQVSFPTINEERARQIVGPAAGFTPRRDDEQSGEGTD